MEDIHVANAKKNVTKAGFLDIEIDPTLDLFHEIERLKKEKNDKQRKTKIKGRLKSLFIKLSTLII